MIDRNYYERSFKHEVCREYLRGGITKQELQFKYGIRGKTSILYWLRNLGYLDSITEPMDIESLKNQKNDSEELKALKKRLAEAELKAEAYQRMIALAERKHNISILKKNDSK